MKDKKNGYGVIKNEDLNEYYEGNWKDNEKSGLGIFKYNYNIKYEGEFRDSLKHGSGDLYFEETNEKYSGQWVEDKA